MMKCKDGAVTNVWLVCIYCRRRYAAIVQNMRDGHSLYYYNRNASPRLYSYSEVIPKKYYSHYYLDEL
jgi:hypothetical protein